MFMADTIAAIASGKIPCAIGILRLSGDDCAQIVDRVFQLQSGLPVPQLPNRKLMMGTLLDVQGRVIDQALVVYTRAPHTYTGEDTVELQCHGSPAVLAAGLESLFAAGARQARPGEFTKRAFLNGQMDLTQAEAVIDLIDAETTDAAANAAGQVGGALVRRLEPIYQGLVDLCSHFHAVLDYPDEDIDEFRLEDFSAQLEHSAAQLSAMLDTCARGQYLKHGVKTVLLGKPNVGKSSLLNALAGFERVIVTEIPGTTRDTVEQSVKLGSTIFRLLDTAGIRQTDNKIEAMGVERSRQAAAQADLALFLCDGSTPLDEADLEALQAAKLAKHTVGVINKGDLPQAVQPQALPLDEVFCISAKTGQGLQELSQGVASLFADTAPCDGSILTNTRQSDAVRRARDAMHAAIDGLHAHVTPDAVLLDIEAAMEAMGELTGKTIREDITQRIFERFCVGK